MKKLNKKGMTLPEVVLAMAVVTIVTITAISIVFSSSVSTKKSMNKIDAEYFLADALECFRASDTAEQYEAAMNFGGHAATEISEAEGRKIYTYKLEDSGYTATVSVGYTDGEDTFTGYVKDLSDNLVIDIIDFKKGG